MSDETEVIQGESLMDDISSVLGNDINAALQDSSINTDDTATLCSETLMAPPSPRPNKHSIRCSILDLKDAIRRDSVATSQHIDNNENNPEQFGFENIVFEIDNRCDDQKIREPSIRYCSLAQFVDGSDITRQSFKVKEII